MVVFWLTSLTGYGSHDSLSCSFPVVFTVPTIFLTLSVPLGVEFCILKPCITINDIFPCVSCSSHDTESIRDALAEARNGMMPILVT